jgi:microcystin-dependent protein
MPLDLQYDMVNYTPADSTPVEANFNRTQQYINTELINRSGSVAMTAQLQLFGDPVAALDAAPKQYVDSFVPIASILMYAGATAPAGGKWALCNGAELEQAAYPILFARIGQTYGGTAGHFNLPNLTQKFPMGVSSTNALGTTGGSADSAVVAHTHAIDHTHAGTNTGVEDTAHGHVFAAATAGANARHTHGLASIELIQHTGAPTFYTAVSGGGGFDIPSTLVNISSLGTTPDSPDHTHNISGGTGGQNVNHVHGVNVPGHSGPSGSTGSSATNANLPPYVTVNYIMRIA